jgi:branched-chain amino acid transport system substrate-binding protein
VQIIHIGGARKTRLLPAAVALGVAVAAAACGASSSGSTGSTGSGGSTQGVTSNQINIGLVTSITGVAGTNFIGGWQGAQARIDLQNSEGGIDGRKLKLVVADDESSPTVDPTAVSSLINTKNVFSLIFISDLAQQGAVVAHQAGVPVVGFPLEPAFGEQPYTNMISTDGDTGETTGNYTYYDQVIHLEGGKKAAYYAISNVPGTVSTAQGEASSASKFGLQNVYDNYSTPLGSVNVGPLALATKNAGADSFFSIQLDTTDFAIMAALKDDGVKLKAPVDTTGYTQSLLDNPTALADAQGLITGVEQVPASEQTPAVQQEVAAFKKYEHFTGVPALNWTFGWVSADMTIKALEGSGSSPTRTAFLNYLHNLKGYNADGLLPNVLDLSLKDFGKDAPTSCMYFVKVEGSAFVPINGGKPICGNLIG